MSEIPDDWPLDEIVVDTDWRMRMYEADRKAEEADPHGIAQHAPGAKLDAGKAPVITGVVQYFPRAVLAVANLSLKGATKYSWRGWHDVPDGEKRYLDALGRHLAMEAIEGEVDSAWTDGDVLHATADAWNALARLELILERREKK